MLDNQKSNNSSSFRNIFVTNIFIFFLSTLIGLNKINNKQNYKYKQHYNLDYNEDITNEDAKMILESKKIGYDILLQTMTDYLDQYQNEDFEQFLQVMWPSDYNILQKSKQKIEGYTRDYQEWEDLFYMMIKNK